MKILKKIRKSKDEKTNNIINNVIGSFIVKGMSIIIGLASMPIYMDYFNDNRILGFWFTILTILIWILNFDFGINNGLRNYLTQSLTERDTLKSKKYVSSAYILVSIFSLALMLLLPLLKYVDLNLFFNISTEIISPIKLRHAITVLLFSLILQLTLKLVNSAIYAIQKAFINNLLILISNASLLVFILLFKFPEKSVEEKFIIIAYARIIAVNLPLIITTIVVFATSLKDCRPSIKYFDKAAGKQVFSLGIMFIIAQLLYMALFTTNEFLITKLTDSRFVVDYQIYNRIFMSFASIATLSLNPVWSAITKAISEKDISWLKNMYKRIIMIGGIATICMFLILPIIQVIINIWLGDKAIKVNFAIAGVMAISNALFLWNGIFSTFATGFGKLKVQTICFLVGIILKITLVLLLINYYQHWLVIIVVHIFSVLIYIIVQPIYIRKWIKTEEHNLVKQNEAN